MSGEILVAASRPAKTEEPNAALRAVGVSAELLTPVTPEAVADARRLAAGAAGVVLCGGPDVDPETFGEPVLAGGHLCVVPERDRLDWELLAGAREAGVPVWGICRGIQVLNVFFGGTLWQDVPSQLAGSLLHDLSFPNDALIHTVTPLGTPEAAGRRTTELLGRETAFVNSRHHQAVRDLGDGLVAVGLAPDGLIEAVELDHPEWWVRAVQWHPENLVPMAQQRALWQEFVDAAAAFADDRDLAAAGGRPLRTAG
jgi:putative glutamine amidotransferase